MFIRSLPFSSADPISPRLAPLVSRLTVRFEAGARAELAPDGQRLTLGIPVLGTQAEEVFEGGGDLRFGCELESLKDGLEEATRRAYSRVLQRAGAAALCRIWNYVPEINATPGGETLENYRAFSRARAQAFETAWGVDFTRRLPAASAVGGPLETLAVVFATSNAEPNSVENPEQMPAYRYPQEHGPRSPSFSRGSQVKGKQAEWVFLSGTAAIKGHRTVAPGELDPQISCTLDNLRLVSIACGVGDDLGAATGWRRQFKVYLRQARDWEAARQRLETGLLRPGDEVVWLQADICRADLEVEIEASLVRPR